MRFRPCIDIHNGTVKQIVGGTLQDQGDQAETNFASQMDGAYYARMYREERLEGGHVILLNSKDSPYYEATRKQALGALRAYPGGMQVGGGITAENARDWLENGASHVIVTSYVFQKGALQEDHLEKLVKAVGKEHIVLDVSCRKREGRYYIVTDRWQKFTDLALTPKVLDRLAGSCGEFLVHGVDVEGKSAGVEEELVRMLGAWGKIPVTYAGGIGTMEELERFQKISGGALDFTVGSALDLFGGKLSYKEICSRYGK